MDVNDFVCDLGQNPHSGKGRLCVMPETPHMFSFLCHGSVYSSRVGRCLLGHEHLAVMGLPCLTTTIFPMPFDHRNVSQHVLKHIAGNAMEMMSVVSWTAYVLAHMKPADYRFPSAPSRVEPLLPLLEEGPMVIEVDDDDDEALQ